MSKLTKKQKQNIEYLKSADLSTFDGIINAIKECAKSKFDESVEIAMNLGVDPRHADQMVRGSVSLPAGLGREVRVAVFARDALAQAAKDAGADIVGAEDLVEIINNGEINFDRCIASPDMMGLVGRVAKILGPKGLMPNPKLGTVTPNVADAVSQQKAGLANFRVEKGGIIHSAIGKVSFESDQLKDNISAFVGAIKNAKPSGAKGQYIQKISISSTMGPSFHIDLAMI